MPLHTDKRGFVYETFRRDGRVCRRYVGKAERERVALALASDATGRRLRDLEREQREKQRAKIEEEARQVAAPVAQLDAQTSALVWSALEAAGYRYTRGQWRKRRDEPMTKSEQREQRQKPTRKEQIEAAKNGDKNAALAVWSDTDALALTGPEGAEKRAFLIAYAGDVAGDAIRLLTNKLTGKDFFFAGGVERKLQEMKATLSGPNPTPLEALLIDRVCACWLQLAFLELRLAGADGLSLKQQESHQRQINSASKRYLASAKTLAQVRRLELPTVQINIGEKQVNIGTFNGQGAPDVAASVALGGVDD